MRVETAAATHVGLVRAVNEDSYLTSPALAVVADGMGGHACGDVASSLAIGAFQPLAQSEGLGLDDVAVALARANQAILDEAVASPRASGMGTTLTGVAVVHQGASPHWLVFNVGDSRVYRVSGSEVSQLTVDHSEVAELVASGRLHPDDVSTHPLRNVITRSLGTDPAPEADTWLIPALPGDRFLLCSDGLSNEVDDQAIGRILGQHEDLEDAAWALIDAAVAAGGRDNVTAVLVGLVDAVEPTVMEDTATSPRVSAGAGT